MDITALGSGAQTGSVVTTPAGSPPQTGSTAQQAASTTATGQTASHEPSAAQVAQAVQKINNSPAVQSQGIEFSIDSSSHRIVVKIVDSDNQVIRQIPSKEALAIAESLDDSPSQGLLIKQQA